MAIRAKHRLKARLAHFAVALAFVLAQCLAVAHADDDHHEHASGADCAICCLAVTDDDLDTPPVYAGLRPNQTLESEIALPTSRIVAGKSDSSSIVRGPPNNRHA